MDLVTPNDSKSSDSKMNKRTLVMICSLMIGLSSVTAYAAVMCPPYQLGVRQINDKDGPIYISVVRAEALIDDQAAIELVQAEVRLEARRELLRKTNLPQLDHRTLRGAFAISACQDKQWVYGVAKISEQTIRQAVRLEQSLGKSLSESPAPQLKTMGDNLHELIEEQKRLMPPSGE